MERHIFLTQTGWAGTMDGCWVRKKDWDHWSLITEGWLYMRRCFPDLYWWAHLLAIILVVTGPSKLQPFCCLLCPLPTVRLKRFKQIVLIIKGHKWLYQKKKNKHINPDPCIHFAEFHFVVWYWSCPLLCLTMLILFSRRNDVENIAGVSGNGMEIQSSIKTWQDEYDLS